MVKETVVPSYFILTLDQEEKVTNLLSHLYLWLYNPFL